MYSQTLEESPISDTKMDISDTTNTSQESPAISPDIEHLQQPNDLVATPNQCDQSSMNTKINSSYNSTEVNRLPIKKSSKTTTTTTASMKNRSENFFQDKAASATTMGNGVKSGDDLDNRKHNLNSLVDDAGMQNSSSLLNNTSTRSALTLANECHPLMSPPATGIENDSDSGSSVHNDGLTVNDTVFNYPDVVPENEPLRLGQPKYHLSVTKIKNTNTDSTSTTTTTTNRALDVLTGTLNTNKANDDLHGSREDVLETVSDFVLSSDNESEPDVSQYQALVTPLFQSVTLTSTPNNRRPSPNMTDTDLIPANTAASSRPSNQRKISVPAELLSDDVSSFDSISNQSFDDLVSASVSSSVFDDTGFNNGADEDIVGTPGTLPLDNSGGGGHGSTIPPYTAADEARDSRSWQKITLPDGRTREIDMKVIEPYKRVLSHGGYLSSGGHNAIVVFSACHLPDRSRTDYHYVMDNLFL